MNDTSKLLLTVVIGGTLLGLGLSRHTSPTMNHSSTADWRDRYRPTYSHTSMQYVDAGPIDSTPTRAWPGAPVGLYQATAQARPDYGPDYQTEYETADYAVLSEEADDSGAAYSLPSAPSVAAALAATATAVELTLPTAGQPAGNEGASEPTAALRTAANAVGSPNGFGLAHPSSSGEGPNGL